MTLEGFYLLPKLGSSTIDYFKNNEKVRPEKAEPYNRQSI